jgi:hypothetical protein
MRNFTGSGAEKFLALIVSSILTQPFIAVSLKHAKKMFFVNVIEATMPFLDRISKSLKKVFRLIGGWSVFVRQGFALTVNYLAESVVPNAQFVQ